MEKWFMRIKTIGEPEEDRFREPKNSMALVKVEEQLSTIPVLSSKPTHELALDRKFSHHRLFRNMNLENSVEMMMCRYGRR